MRAFVTRRLPGRALMGLTGICEVDVWPSANPPDYVSLRRRARDVDGLLSLLTDRVDAAFLDACPRLRVISNMAVGVDNIDLEAARRRGISVANTPEVLTDATADLTLALLLAAARRLGEGEAAVRDGTWGPWKPDWLLGLELRGAQLGIIGMGRIGAAVATRARAFGMDVVHTSRRSGLPLAELLRSADVISLHCPLLPETRHLIDRVALSTMKPGAILVNTARGGIVDQHALSRALHSGHLAAAAIDVTDPEPLPSDHPLLRAPNLTVLPHLGSATTRTRERMASLAVENLRAGLVGQPLPRAVAPLSDRTQLPSTKEIDA
jgi:lactate dehydrogenase-like 2-hydroxyacid dehydrogenase